MHLRPMSHFRGAKQVCYSRAPKIINDCHCAVAEGLLMIETVDAFLARLKQRDPHQPEFHQAVEEVVRSL